MTNETRTVSIVCDNSGNGVLDWYVVKKGWQPSYYVVSTYDIFYKLYCKKQKYNNIIYVDPSCSAI